MKNISCLSCNSPPGHESTLEHKPYESPRCVRRCCGIEGCWSGNPSPPPYAYLRSESMKVASKEKKVHRKMLSTGSPLIGGFNLHSPPEEPRLMRSGGIRRDWSFEDVRKQKAATTKDA